MARPSTGVITVPGTLTAHLEELDLSRKEVAERLGVSVRTIHNIEHGRKRVDRRLLSKLCVVLNDEWYRSYPVSKRLLLSPDHFCSDPVSIANLGLRSISLNRPNLLLNEHAPVDPRLSWLVEGNPDKLPFAGEFDISTLGHQIDTYNRTLEFVGRNETLILTEPTKSRVVVRTVSRVKHCESGNAIRLKVFKEFDVKGAKLRRMETTFDSERVAEFLSSGIEPQKHRG